MDSQELELEEEHLINILDEIDRQLTKTARQIMELEKEMKELTSYFADEYYNMDDEEAVTGGDDLDEHEAILFKVKEGYSRLKRQRESPFFGRIDFKEDGKKKVNPYYIGVFSLTNNGVPYVCDWRAPISSMYYDYEIGHGQYLAPDGLISGEISKKRQYKIINSKLKYCFDSNLTIGDDILQMELSNNTTYKMKNIVSTIQKEQNKIIRNEEDNVIFVQGVAGSGKTSVALHRAAYLLYSKRDKITANDLLILSPNNVFAEYISAVLPELGENNIQQTSFYEIARQELSTLAPQLETREEMLAYLSSNETTRINEVAYKNSFDFYESLNMYLHTYVNLKFEAKDLVFGETKIKKATIEDLFNKKYADKTPAVKVDWITDYVVDQLNVGDKAKDIYPRVKKLIYPMLGVNNIVDLYADFLEKIGMNFSLLDNGKVKNEDVAPLLLIKDYILGVIQFKDIKYLIVDEMQDYSPVHLDLINKAFNCNKTFLGDINQCIEKIITEDDLSKMAKMCGANKVIKMNKTYRSTYEITEFASKLKNIECDKVARHGEEPKVVMFDDEEKQIDYIKQVINNSENYNTVAIITKTEQQANYYYALLGDFDELSLMNEDSKISRLMIMPASLSKGLEFDVVIVPDIKNDNKKKFIDKNLLYVSCTRALHKLYLTGLNN